MRPLALRTLTWATVAAAVASALWLAAGAGDPGATLRLTAAPDALLPLARPGAPGIERVATRRHSHEPQSDERSKPLR